MKKIKLTQGLVALVDDEDFEYLNQWKWYATGMSKKYMKAKNNEKGLMHRFIMKLSDPNIVIDHSDHNTLNNQKNNLRIATKSQNMMNRKPQKNNTTGVPGIVMKRNRFQVQIGINGEFKYLGCFKTLDEAIKIRKKAEKELFGEFAFNK